MTNTMQNPTDCTTSYLRGLAAVSLKSEGETGESEHEYIPMDVYVHIGTVEKPLEDWLDGSNNQIYLPMDIYIDCDSVPRN